MNPIFEAYPPTVFRLLLLLVIQQLAYHIFLFEFNSGFYFISRSEWSNPMLQEFYWFNGVLIILSGWLADLVSDVRTGLLWAAVAMLFGNILAYTPGEVHSFFGSVLVLGGSSFFVILCYIHLGILFPEPDDRKENSFMLLLLIPLLINTISPLLYYPLYGLLGAGNVLLLKGGIHVVLILLVYELNGIGYQITAEEGDEEKKPSPLLLAGATVLHTIVWLAVNYVSLLGVFSTASGPPNYNYSLIYLTHFLPAPLLLVAAFVCLRYAGRNPGQLSRLLWGLGLLIAIGLPEVLVRFTNSYTLDGLLGAMPEGINALLILPVLLSVLTHLNFYFRPACWMGIFLGAPQIIYHFADQWTDHIPMFRPFLAIVLTIGAFMWLRMNRERLTKLLQLNEPSLTVRKEAAEGDPFDHLVG